MPEYNPDTDPRSSNTLIRAYLASKGLPLNGENVRRAMEANNANAGTIPGLVNSLPSTEAEDQAAMAAARGGGGGGGGGARTAPAAPATLPAAQQDTSAPPGAATPGSDGDDGSWLLPLAAGGAGAALAPLLNRLRGSGASNTRVPGGPGQPGMDIGNVSLSLNRPQLPPPVDVGGAQVNLGRQPRLLSNAAPPSLGAGIVNGEPLSIGAPAPQLAAPQSMDARPVANPNEPMPMRGPGPPPVIPLPAPPVVAPPPQLTDTVPAIDAVSPRVKTPRTRAPRARVSARI